MGGCETPPWIHYPPGPVFSFPWAVSEHRGEGEDFSREVFVVIGLSPPAGRGSLRLGDIRESFPVVRVHRRFRYWS